MDLGSRLLGQLRRRRSTTLVVVVVALVAVVAGWSLTALGADASEDDLGRLSASGPEQGVAVRSAPEEFPRGIVVIGDSITAKYDDHAGSPQQGWWSFVARHFDSPVTTYAQSGSGYLRRGLRCRGNRFIDRPAVYRGHAPSLLLVEGGRNDWRRCHRDQRAPDWMVAQAVTTYLTTLEDSMPSSTRIVVLGPPWGPLDQWENRRITSIVRTAARRLGLEYVSTQGTIASWDRSIDGVHPNRAGSKALAERVVAELERPATES